MTLPRIIDARGEDARADDPGAARQLEAMVASAFAVRPEAIRNKRRGRARAAFARQVAMYLTHTRLGLTYTAAGSLFGRDRTTAAHACRTVENRREDPKVDAAVNFLERAMDVWPEAEPSRLVPG